MCAISKTRTARRSFIYTMCYSNSLLFKANIKNWKVTSAITTVSSPSFLGCWVDDITLGTRRKYFLLQVKKVCCWSFFPIHIKLRRPCDHVFEKLAEILRYRLTAVSKIITWKFILYTSKKWSLIVQTKTFVF